MAVPSPVQVAWIQRAVFALCLLPAANLGWRAWQGVLGANPIEAITRASGWWTLSLLVLTLSVTPLRTMLSWPWLLRLRRMLGLFAFAYGSCHFTTYLWLDQFFDGPAILRDIAKRPFVTVGFAAFVLMAPLAGTSTNAMVRRLGARRWQTLHRLVYAIAVLGVLHYWWLVKRDVREPAAFGAVVAVLLAWRVAHRWRATRHGRGEVALPGHQRRRPAERARPAQTRLDS